MSDMGVLRDELLATWLRSRDLVINQVEQLSEAQLEWRPGAGARTTLQIAEHIEQSAQAFLEYAKSGQRPAGNVEEGSSDATRASVLDGLKRGRGGIESGLRGLTRAELVEKIPGMFGPTETTRFGLLSFGCAHEFYHSGQLALCARGAGEIPAITKMMQRRTAS